MNRLRLDILRSLTLAVLLLLAACSDRVVFTAPEPRLVDLTHPFDETDRKSVV